MSKVNNFKENGVIYCSIKDTRELLGLSEDVTFDNYKNHVDDNGVTDSYSPVRDVYAKIESIFATDIISCNVKLSEFMEAIKNSSDNDKPVEKRSPEQIYLDFYNREYKVEKDNEKKITINDKEYVIYLSGNTKLYRPGEMYSTELKGLDDRTKEAFYVLRICFKKFIDFEAPKDKKGNHPGTFAYLGKILTRIACAYKLDGSRKDIKTYSVEDLEVFLKYGKELMEDNSFLFKRSVDQGYAIRMSYKRLTDFMNHEELKKYFIDDSDVTTTD